jgi:hypothetical protein
MRYGISAAALMIQNRQVLLVNHGVAGQFDFWLPPGEYNSPHNLTLGSPQATIFLASLRAGKTTRPF